VQGSGTGQLACCKRGRSGCVLPHSGCKSGEVRGPGHRAQDSADELTPLAAPRAGRWRSGSCGGPGDGPRDRPGLIDCRRRTQGCRTLSGGTGRSDRGLSGAEGTRNNELECEAGQQFIGRWRSCGGWVILDTECAVTWAGASWVLTRGPLGQKPSCSVCRRAGGRRGQCANTRLLALERRAPIVV
jgi:hypothetical protein